MTRTLVRRGKLSGVETPRRTVRVPDDVWRRAAERASETGTTVSERVVEWLDRFGRGDDAR